MNDYINNETKDEIFQELWNAKDYYSLSCNSDFKVLVRKVKDDIKKLDNIDDHEEIKEVCVS